MPGSAGPRAERGPRSAARPRQGRKELEGAGVWARRRTRAESLLAEGEPARLDSLDSVVRRGQRRREGLSAVVDQAKSFLLPAQSLFDCLCRCTFLSGSRTEENAIPTSISLHASACLCAFECLRLDRGRRVLHPETEGQDETDIHCSTQRTQHPATNNKWNCKTARARFQTRQDPPRRHRRTPTDVLSASSASPATQSPAPGGWAQPRWPLSAVARPGEGRTEAGGESRRGAASSALPCMQGTEGARYGVSMSGPECDGRRVTGAGDPRRRRAGRNSEGSRDSPGHARAYSGPPISWARRAAKDVSAEASPVLAWGSKRGFCQAAGVRRLRHVLRTSWGRDAGETRPTALHSAFKAADKHTAAEWFPELTRAGVPTDATLRCARRRNSSKRTRGTSLVTLYGMAHRMA